MKTKLDYQPTHDLEEYINNKISTLDKYVFDYNKIFGNNYRQKLIFKLIDSDISMKMIDKQDGAMLLEKTFSALYPRAFYDNIYYLFNILNFAGEKMRGKIIEVEYHTKNTEMGVAYINFGDVKYEKFIVSLIKEIIRLTDLWVIKNDKKTKI